ncbi:MAG: ABC transporter permease [Dehalococcoidia bacterium]
MTTTMRLAAPRVRLRSVTGIWMRHFVALLRVWRVAMTWFLIEPAFILLAVGFGIGRIVGDFDEAVPYAVFVTPGIIIGSAMFHALFECSWNSYHRIDNRLYETMLTTPLSVSEMAIGEILWATTRALITTVTVGIFAAALGWLDSWTSLGVLLAAIFIGVQFGAMGLIFAALAPNTHSLSLVFTVVATPLYFFSGAFFPISVLPEWAQPFAWAAPLTPGVHLARGFVMGSLDITHLWSVLYMIGLTAVIYPVAVHLLKRRLIK